MVSHSGDPHGNVDAALAKQGLSRRVVVTVPNFHFALTLLANADLIAAMPSRFVALHGQKHDVVAVKPPLQLPAYRLSAVAPRVAFMDAGLNWLVERLQGLVD